MSHLHKYKITPVSESDLDVDQEFQTNFTSITAMREYENASLEELRLADYLPIKSRPIVSFPNLEKREQYIKYHAMLNSEDGFEIKSSSSLKRKKSETQCPICLERLLDVSQIIQVK